MSSIESPSGPHHRTSIMSMLALDSVINRTVHLSQLVKENYAFTSVKSLMTGAWTAFVSKKMRTPVEKSWNMSADPCDVGALGSGMPVTRTKRGFEDVYV